MAYTPHPRSSSPGRRSTTPLPALPDIPEASPAPVRPTPARTVTPGANAFARQAARVEKHRLQSNAFYQQEMQKRIVTLPTAVHPALRDAFSLDTAAAHPSLTGVRDSGLTTMSPFIKASGLTPPTPPMLVPKDSVQAYPTDRGFIEDKREQLQHENSGSDNERTPVFIHTPKISSSEFSKSTGYATPKKKKVGVLDWATSSEHTKMPKKGFLEKLRFTTPRSSSQAPASTNSLGADRGYGVYGGGETLPPKAKAVLSSSPHEANLGRSPSKKKGLFSRKASEQPSLDTRTATRTATPTCIPKEPRSAGALTVSFSDSAGKTPQTAHTAFSDPTYDRHSHSKLAVSQAHSEQGGGKQQVKDKQGNACGVYRSQSLQYFDRKTPPTPPAKNTPPHEKELRAQQELRLIEKTRLIMEDHRKASEQRRLEIMRNITPKKEMVQTPSSKLKSPLHQGIFEDDTPTRETAKLIGADGRTSPTKFGTYGRKEVPTLVKQPSVYSMHASYYPDLHDQCSFEEMKKRTDGLGLEGLSELPESFYNSEPKITYSPSLYSEDFGTRSSVIQTSPSMLHQMGFFKHSPSLPAVIEHQRPMPSKASLQEKASGSSHGTIPLMYPGLATDPSRSDLEDSLHTHHRSTSEIQLPVHSREKSSPTHNRSPRKSAANELAKGSDNENTPLSPPTYSCPSAMPSPLQFLPNTVYTPPRNNKTDAVPASPSSTRTLTPSRSRGRIETFKSTGSPIARSSNSPFESTGSSTTRSSNSPFDNLPTLSPTIKPSLNIPPPATAIGHQPEPRKQEHGPSPTPHATDLNNGQQEQEQQDTPDSETVQVMLRRMQSQQDEIAHLKSQLRTLGARYAHYPEQLTPDPSSAGNSDVGQVSSIANLSDHEERSQSQVIAPYVTEGSLAQLGLYHRMRQQRVDQDYDANQVADMDRYDHSDYARRPRRNGMDASAMGEVMDIAEMLARKIRELEGTTKQAK